MGLIDPFQNGAGYLGPESEREKWLNKLDVCRKVMWSIYVGIVHGFMYVFMYVSMYLWMYVCTCLGVSIIITLAAQYLSPSTV